MFIKNSLENFEHNIGMLIRYSSLFKYFRGNKVFSNRISFEKLEDTKKGSIYKGSIYLGQCPDKFATLTANIHSNQISILSVLHTSVANNGYWKKEGLNIPVSMQTYKNISVRDHKALDLKQLDKAADYIKAELDKGNDVFVHCKAGQGRSAMAVAAYFIKYKKMPTGRAASIVCTNRPQSTLLKLRYGKPSKKIQKLARFEIFCRTESLNYRENMIDKIWKKYRGLDLLSQKKSKMHINVEKINHLISEVLNPSYTGL